MPDQTLICQNCHNPFVFSEGEQRFFSAKALPQPTYCPICRSLKVQEKTIPPKPQN